MKIQANAQPAGLQLAEVAQLNTENRIKNSKINSIFLLFPLEHKRKKFIRQEKLVLQNCFCQGFQSPAGPSSARPGISKQDDVLGSASYIVFAVLGETGRAGPNKGKYLRRTPEKSSFFRLSAFWHERSALQLVAVRRTIGNDVGGHYFHLYFFFTFSHRRIAQIKKLILRKLTGAPKTYGQTPFQTPSTILGPPGGHF